MDWKKKTVILYALGGLIIGIAAGIMTVKNAEDENKEVEYSLKNGLKVGLAAINAVRKNVLN